MAILPEQLEPRADLIAFICSRYGRVGTKKEWWGSYERGEGLKVVKWTDTFVDYRREDAGSATIYFTDVQPAQVRNVKESDPVLLDSKIIDAASITSRNVGAVDPAGLGVQPASSSGP